MTKKKKKETLKERYKKTTHKLTPKLIEFIRESEGKLSYRQICKEVARMTGNRCTIHPSAVHYVIKGRAENAIEPPKTFIYDLIEQAQENEEFDIESLSFKTTKY